MEVRQFEESVFLHHAPCNVCGSSDANAHYSDGTTYCFACQTWSRNEEYQEGRTDYNMNKDFLTAHPKALASRKISEETCKRYGYRVAVVEGSPVQVADYRKDGELVAQKIRTPDKQFRSIGNPIKAGFFGQHLFKADGKMLVVTEGEIDAMSVYQAMGSKWPAVSLPGGAQSAEKVFRQELNWLESFDKVVICFDQDEPGQEAAVKVAQLLEPGKAVLTSLPEKDANECLKQRKADQLVRAIWDAHPYRPDGVLDAKDLWELVTQTQQFESIPYPWQGLSSMTHGIRKGELVTFCSGSGMGKSSVIRELMYYMISHGNKVGSLFLEESVKRTLQGLMGLHLSRPLHLEHMVQDVPTDDLRAAFDATAGTGRLMVYDHFGSSDIDQIIDKIKFMAANGCDFIFLDHVSMVVSGLETSDERKLIDVLMTKLRTVVSRFDVGLIVVSHLKRPEGTALEEGAQTSLSLLRGSASIAQLSDMCVGLERNQQADKPEDRNKTKLRVLKNRYSGETGVCCTLNYDRETGRLSEEESSDLSIVYKENQNTDDPYSDIPF